MKKNGFTLVELLAVIIILAILYLFVMPKVTDLIKDGNKTDEYIIQNKIITAAKEYTSNYDTRFLNDFINIGYSKFINKEDLINNKLLDENELDSIGFFKVKVTLKEDNKLEYTISYEDIGKILLSVNLNGGSMISDPTGEYEVGSTVTLNTPTKSDYEFSHWSIEVGNSILSGNMLTIGDINTTIKANWFKKITLTIDLNGGIGNNQGGIYSSNSTITLEEPTKDDHVFAGWKIVSGDAVISGSALTFGLEDVSVKATWFKKVTEFAYNGSEQEFIAPLSGYYTLEVWGAQGGSSTYNSSTCNGGYGGYSNGKIYLTKGTTLYINVGGQGIDMDSADLTYSGGYNGGGGRKYAKISYAGEGGGATHIATISGLLSTLHSSIDKILIVSGGGGGAKRYDDLTGNYSGTGGSGGGFIGADGVPVNQTVYGYGLGGSQTSGGSAQVILSPNGLTYGSFGLGAVVNASFSDEYGDAILVGAGGGGGFYGGGSIEHGPAGGGSGYIGNTLLTNKSMYCYNCSTSSEESTKTISTTCTNETPTKNCAKKGNGYAKITYFGE